MKDCEKIPVETPVEIPERIERKRCKSEVDKEKIGLIILMAFLTIAYILSVVGYICNWQTYTLVYSIGMGTTHSVAGLICLYMLIFCWD